ncbi:MAG: 1,4-alpha-glucan branching protein GlgB [Clostridia bacterium]|nr:1,4-alpha-glucan branching protein GlgB [Clostridia bacterium]
MKKTDTALSQYLFHQGTNFHAYTYLGCHESREGEQYHVTFRTWAPNAASVSVVGDPFGWEEGFPLSRATDRGVWEGVYVCPASLVGTRYKFRITAADGRILLRGDPYAFSSEGGAGGASFVTKESDYTFRDGEWMEHRRRTVCEKEGEFLSAPLHIYEMHALSFLRHEDGSPYSYRELADFLVPYLKRMGYTHVELLPLAEHPFEGSWGYQIGAYYAPHSHLGSSDDLRYFVDTLHRAGIGVLMDWVPAHFPKDEWGLYEFDGKPLYEYQGYDRMESRGWGTRYFDLGREEVQCFLVSNALYWLREFHLDGLRVDAVAAMLYRDYDRAEGEWTPNSYGGRENLEAISFFHKLNAAVSQEFPDALMIAEESTAFPAVTTPASEGGLGFSLKWNMGFANDFFSYLGRDPIFRRYHHTALTFPMMYAYSERYVLPISHDEVVYGKRSLFSKIAGNRDAKFSTFRAAMTFIMTFPGKKMTFMGTEFGQENEWNHMAAVEFSLLDDPRHRDLLEFTAALNRFYLTTPALWERDFSPEGFSWIDVDNADRNLVAYRRRDARGGEIIVVISFSGSDLYDYRLSLVEEGVYDTVFFSGEWSEGYEKEFRTQRDEGGVYLMMRVPACSAVLLRRREDGVCFTVRGEA